MTLHKSYGQGYRWGEKEPLIRGKLMDNEICLDPMISMDVKVCKYSILTSRVRLMLWLAGRWRS